MVESSQEIILSKEKQAETILRQWTQDFLVYTDSLVGPPEGADEKAKNQFKLARDRAAAVRGFLGSSNGSLTKNIEGIIDNQQVPEGLPVEGVIEYLDQEQLKLENKLGGGQKAIQLALKVDRGVSINELQLTDELKEALVSYRKLISDRKLIYGHTESYFPNVPVSRSEGRVAQKGTDAFYYNEGTPAHRRVKLEAKIISEDPARASQASTEEERQRENFQKAIDAMDSRRMYRYKETKSTQKVGRELLNKPKAKSQNMNPMPISPNGARLDLQLVAQSGQARRNDQHISDVTGTNGGGENTDPAPNNHTQIALNGQSFAVIPYNNAQNGEAATRNDIIDGEWRLAGQKPKTNGGIQAVTTPDEQPPKTDQDRYKEDDLKDDLKKLIDEIDRLKEENRKLREELDGEGKKGKGITPVVPPVTEAESASAPEATPFVVGIDNQNEDIEKRAREIASERLRGLQNEKKGNIFKKIFNGVKFNIFGEGYRQKYIKEARLLMIQHGTTAIDVTAAHTFALASADVIKRFQSDREAAASRLGLLAENDGLGGGGQERWRQAEGGTRIFLMDQVFSKAVSGVFTDEAALQKHLTNLMKQVSDGTLTVSPQVKTDLIEMFGKDQNMSGKTSEAFASNILTMAEKVRETKDFKDKGLDAVAEQVRFVIGKSAWAAQTEASYNVFDKAFRQLNKSRIGRVFGNHYVFTAATVGALTTVTKGLLGANANLIFPIVGGAVVGGAVAGLQKGFELKTDRLTHQVEMAYARQFEQGSKNREKMDRHIYSMVTVDELIYGGGVDRNGATRSSMDDLLRADLSEDGHRRAVMERIAEIQARMDFSIQNKVDLIKYKDRESVAQGRLALTRSLVRARKALETSGISSNQLTRGAIETHLGVNYDELFTNEKKAKDQEFNRYVRGEMAKRFSISSGFGIGAGTLIGFARENGLFDAAAKTIKDAEIGALRGIDQGLKSAGIDTSGIKAAAHAVVDVKNTVLHGAREVAAAISPSAKIGEIQVGQHLEGFFDKGPRAIGKFMGELKGNDLHLSVAGQSDTVLHLVNGKIDLSGQAKVVVDALRQSGFNVTETSQVNTVFENLLNIFTTENVGGIPVKTPDGLKWITNTHGGFDLVDKTDSTKVIMKGVHFVKDAKGLWTVDHTDIIDFPGQNAQVLSETITGVKNIDVLGSNGEWEKHAEKLAKVDWYANNTAYSDHNELRMYTHKLGKKIILDMGGMKSGGSFQNGLPGADVPSIVKDGKAAFSFFLPGIKEPLIVPAGVDGKLVLDPEDMKTIVKFTNGTKMPLGKLTEMLINKDEVAKIVGDGDIATELNGRQSIFNLGGTEGKGVGIISAGRLVKDATNNQSEWHSFAAIRGCGATPATIDLPSTDTIPRIEIPRLVSEMKGAFAELPPAVEVIDKKNLVIGYTPIPFLTDSLENLKNKESLNTYYLDFMSGVSDGYKGKERHLMSPQINENPSAVLDHQAEYRRYFESQSPEYQREISELSKQITEPISDKLKSVVCIPVAGHQEEGKITKTLEAYLPQTANKKEYEVLLFINWPSKDRDGNSLNATKVLEEVNKFKKDHPDFPLRIVAKEFQTPGNIGMFRKYATDIALYRNAQRTKNEEIIIISNDADCEGVAPQYIQNFIEKFGADKSVDGMLGQLDWDPKSYIQYPILHVGTRLFQYLATIGRHNTGRMPSSGANFAFRSSIYSAVGGYNEATVGEDVMLGRDIIHARGSANAIKFAGARASRIYTSSRRAISVMKQGLAPVEQWDKGFSLFDDEIRKMQLGQSTNLNYDDPQFLLRLKEGLETVINRTLDVYERGENLGKDAFYYKKALRFLGIEYKVLNGKVVISDMSSLVKGLKEYQQYGAELMAVKSGRKINTSDHQIEVMTNKSFNTPILSVAKLESNPIISPEFVDNAKVKFDPEKERNIYLERQSKEYLKQLESLNQQIGTKMNKATEAVVLMPVAGAQESSRIYSTIKSFGNQNVDTSRFELVLFVNVPESKALTERDKFDTTLSEIARAQKDFPNVNIRVASAILPNDQVRIGNIRKILTDLSLLRAREQGIKRDVLLISNDADNEGISGNYIQAFLNYFSAHPDKDGAVGNLQYDPKSFVRFPLGHARTELVTLLDQQGFKNGNVDLFGSNSAMKTSIYSAIGGYPSILKTGEQEWTGDTIRALRKSRDTLGYVEDAILVTSDRRNIQTIQSGAKSQVAFGDTKSEEAMRSLDYSTFPYFDFDSTDIEKFKAELSITLNELINGYESGEHLGKNSWFYKDNLKKIGIEYEVQGDPTDRESKIVVVNVDRFIERSKKMRQCIESGEKDMARIYQTVALGDLGK